ncbi:glycosyltransferase involved in cell wall biosynthesis [Mucilaginibacter sp. HD30]
MSVSMLSEQLSLFGIATQVYTTTANGKEELAVTTGMALDIDGVPVTYFKRLTGDHTHLSPALLRKIWVHAADFDIIHIHAWWNLVSLGACLIARMRGIKTVISPRGTLSDYSFTKRNSYAKAIIHRLAGKALLEHAHIHVTSEREELAILNIIRPKSISNLPNFVKLPSEKTDLSYPPSTGAFRLLFFSRIDEKKGVDLLIKALPFLDFSFTLTIAGPGEAEYVNQLKELAQQNGTMEHITWLGLQSVDKFDLLATHHLLILPSQDENFGNVLIESLSQGTAVLVSPFVGLADYITHHDLGWICAAEPGVIGKTINTIAADEDKIRRIRKDAPDIIRVDFDEAALAGRYVMLYADIVNQKVK